MYQYQRGEVVHWHTIDHRANPFLNHLDFLLNLWHMLVSTGQVDSRTAKQLQHLLIKRFEFPISLDEHNLKSLLKVKVVHCLQSTEDSGNFTIS